MKRKNGYRLTPANTSEHRLGAADICQHRLEAQADEILARNKENLVKRRNKRRKHLSGSLFEQKHRANVKCADFDAKVSNHIDSIMIEV